MCKTMLSLFVVLHFPRSGALFYSLSMPLFAGEHLCPLTARVALDKAAPVEFAVALPHLGVLVCVVASSAAHHVAAVGVGRGAVAEPSLRPHAPCGGIFLTVVG